MEAFRVHIKPLENRELHLQTNPDLKSLKKMLPKYNNTELFQVLLALFWTP